MVGASAVGDPAKLKKVVRLLNDLVDRTTDERSIILGHVTHTDLLRAVGL
jgi:hypothetical protein